MPRTALFAVLCCVLQSTAFPCANDPLVEASTVTASEDELGDAYERALANSVSKELLERAQRLWEDFRQANCDLIRQANCELISARNDARSAEAAAQCQAFMARERSFELRLLSY